MTRVSKLWKMSLARFTRTGLVALIVAVGLDLTNAQTGTVPTSMHPGFDLIPFRPTAFKPRVTGMGWLSDGRMVVASWGGTNALIHTRQMNSTIYLVSGAGGANPTGVTTSVFASGLEDVMGLAVVNDRIYVCGGNDLLELVDADKNGVSESKRTVFHLDNKGKGRHEFLFGLLYRDGKFYVNASSPKLNLTPEDSTFNTNRGTMIVVDEKTGAFTLEAMGLRTPNGMGFGPDGVLLVPDVQGNWLPANKLIAIKKGAYYGFKHTPRETWDNMTETPPAVYIPQDNLGNAPGNPLYLTFGPYAGQVLMGDVRHGGVQRYFLEKVGGEWQGAGFHFIGGVEAGVERLALGPDSMIYVGGVGDPGGTWDWNNTTFGLQKLRVNGKTGFDMLAIRSLGNSGFEIEFTQPLASGADAAANFKVKSWYYTPTASYGGGSFGNKTLTVSKVTVSADRKKVVLDISGLEVKRIVNFQLTTAVKSESGTALWTPEAWYSLNAFGPGSGPTPIAAPQRKAGYTLRRRSSMDAVHYARTLVERRRNALGQSVISGESALPGRNPALP